MLDIGRTGCDECRLCMGGCEDDWSHYATCPSIKLNAHIRRGENAFNTISIFRDHFSYIALNLHGILMHIISSLISRFAEIRPDLSRDTRDHLLYTYLSDLTDCSDHDGVDMIEFIRDIHTLPSAFHHTTNFRRLTLFERKRIFSHSDLDIDAYIVSDLNDLPSNYVRWGCLRYTYRSIARHFGEFRFFQDRCPHISVIILICFSQECPLYFSYRNRAFKRARAGGRTWIIHNPRISIRSIDKNLYISTTRLFMINITCISHPQWIHLHRDHNHRMIIHRSLDSIRSVPKMNLIFPSFSRGRFSKLIPLVRLPRSHRAILIRLRNFSANELMTGCIGDIFDDFLVSDRHRKKLQKQLWERFMPLMIHVYNQRLIKYSFLRQNFDLFHRKS